MQKEVVLIEIKIFISQFWELLVIHFPLVSLRNTNKNF